MQKWKSLIIYQTIFPIDKTITKKKREFTVQIEIYSFVQEYAIEYKISPKARLFPIIERAVQYHLKKVWEHLGYEGISTHSFRKYFATDVYLNNQYNIELVRTLLQHSSVVTTQRYIGIQCIAEASEVVVMHVSC